MRTMICGLALFVSLSVSAQQEITPFTIDVTRTRHGFEATCAEGCAWKSGSITNHDVTTFYLDFFGFNEQVPAVEKDKPPFQMTIDVADPDKLVLTSGGGTAWSNLAFNLRAGQTQRVTAFGASDR